MKGVILAGGTGSRLFPSTRVTNKHLLPVYNRPMITYPIETLKNSGVRDILVITSSQNASDFLRFLGSGKDFGVNFTYKVQDGAGGIAQALSLAEGFAAGDSVAVILGDNIFEDDFSEQTLTFRNGAHIFLKPVDDPERFGVVELDSNGLVQSITEKPMLPKSNLAQAGMYIYDAEVFDIIRTLKPSDRGELEITDVNQVYLEKGALKASKLKGMWIDAGTHESLLEASILAQEVFGNEGGATKKMMKPLPVRASVQPKISIGVVLHNSEKYVRPCFTALQKQNYKNVEILVFDNASTDEGVSILKQEFSDITVVESKENIGFAKAHNQLIKQSNGEFYACVNVDAFLEPNFLTELFHAIQQKPNIGSVGGKLKRWNFEAFEKGDTSEGKTNFIDSTGIALTKAHKFFDKGQGEVDFGQYDEESLVFGVSGAAALYRKKSLEDVAFENEHGEKEFFDEAMFLYKEDVDLAYRLQWAGWKSAYTPMAVGYHDRTNFGVKASLTETIKHRMQKPAFINKQSYINHKVLLEKNFSSDFSSDVQGATGWYNFKKLLYIIIAEPENLVAWWKVRKMKNRLNAWRKSMPKRVNKAEIEQLME